MRVRWPCILASSVLSLGVMLSACAIHPLPEDVTGLDTYQIVRQIRCETRAAGKKLVLDTIRAWAQAELEPSEIRAISQRILDHYDNDSEEFAANFHPDKEFAGDSGRLFRDKLDSIYGLGLTYAFDLNMTDQGSLNPSAANFVGPWASKFTLGLAGNFTGKRNNDRKFTVTDTMGKLFSDLAKPREGQFYCNGQIAGPNQIYPIAGEIGVYKTLHNFLQLAVFTNFDTQQKTGGTAPLVDQLAFTTTIDVSLTPKITFKQIGSGFQTSDLSGTFDAQRTDIHQVTIGVALDSTAQAQLAELRDFVFSRKPTVVASAKPKKAGPIGTLAAQIPPTFETIIVAPTSEAEALSALAVDQFLSHQVQVYFKS